MFRLSTSTALSSLVGLALFACNQPPTDPAVTINPTEAYTGDTLQVIYDGSTDANKNDTVSYRVSWARDGVRQADLTDVDQVVPRQTTKGQEWTATVTPWDGKILGNPVSASVTVLNTPPEVQVSVSPENPDTNDRIRVTTTKSDADGDGVSLTYQWVLNGSPQTDSSDTLPSNRTNKGEVWEVRVIANDGEVDAEPVALSVTIANTPPSVATATVSEPFPDKTSTLTCIGEGWEDIDDDPEGYDVEWVINGTAFSTDASLNTAELTRGDRIRCHLTPNDGDDDGITARRALGISPPTAIVPSGTLASTTLRRGTMSGTTYNDDCGGDEMLVGISGGLTKSGGYFASLAPRCAELELDCEGTTCTVNTGTVTIGTKRGGTGTVTVNRDCDDGEVVVGFRGRYGWYLDQITLRCAPVEVTHNGSDWEISLGTSGDIAAVGGTGGSAFAQTDCSSGKLATRAASGQVDGFGLGCQDPDLGL